jgi:hypothetical protein
VSDDTMGLTHQDLVEAFDRVIQQLKVIDESTIFKNINVGMFDIEDALRVLSGFKGKLIVDAHQKGALEWK